MRKAKIFFKDEEAGILTQHDDGSFSLNYNEIWLASDSKPAISLSFPKSEKAFHSKVLFPFFFNMLPEGSNKQVSCKMNKIDPADDFGLLMATSRYDSIGAVTVIKIEE